MISKQIIARNASCNAIVGLLDIGSTYPSGHLSIYDSSSNLIFWHPLSNPAFGSAIDGTSISGIIFDTTALIDSTANYFSFDNCDGTSIWTGDVGLPNSSASLWLESLYISADSTDSITSAVFVVPA
jgi:hypothetical protein